MDGVLQSRDFNSISPHKRYVESSLAIGCTKVKCSFLEQAPISCRKRKYWSVLIARGCLGQT
jgi:hypothetical protein